MPRTQLICIFRWLSILPLLIPAPALGLDPAKTLTQYSSAVWTQQQGLPQDAIRAIAQTTDGYLWLGTDEGLARFDGYDFVVFRKGGSGLISNSITSLAAGADRSLWIGTPRGLSSIATAPSACTGNATAWPRTVFNP